MINKIKMIFYFPLNIWEMVINYLPGQIGFILRYRYWKKRLKFLGKNVRIDVGVHFGNPSYIEINDNCWIDRNVMIIAGPDQSEREKVIRKNNNFPGKPGVVYIGKNIHIGPNCIISGISSGVYISDDCGFSANCMVYAFSHHYRSKKASWNKEFHFGPQVDYDRQCILEGPIFIGNNTGIALNSVILPGVSIPQNCFVAINSLVVGGVFRENSIISGNPASTIGSRFSEEK